MYQISKLYQNIILNHLLTGNYNSQVLQMRLYRIIVGFRTNIRILLDLSNIINTITLLIQLVTGKPFSDTRFSNSFNNNNSIIMSLR